MLDLQKPMVTLAFALFAASSSAGPLVYVTASDLANGTQQFGTVDLATGTFQQIGSSTPEGESGLVRRPNGSFLTLGFSGGLNSIAISTGVHQFAGATGLADCTTSASPFGLTSAANLAGLGGSVYATDFSNNLYTVDPVTGAATLIGPTGIPAFAFNPTIPNADGSHNIFDYSLFSSGGNLYEIFDVARLDGLSFAITPVIPANLYRIDPLTGVATLIAPTALNLTAVVDVNGTLYAFNAATGQVVTLDLATGNTSFVSNLDPAAGLILGAAPIPEPASLALAGIGIAGMLIRSRRKRRT